MMTKLLRFRVYRVWNMPENHLLHGTRQLVYSSNCPGNAHEFALERNQHWCCNDHFIVEDSEAQL